MAVEWDIKKQIIEIGQRLWSKGFVAANDGNISVRLDDNRFLCTPTGVSKGFLTPPMILKIDAGGNLLSGKSLYKPSSEIMMHLEVYRERKDIQAVVHAHPPHCTAFAVAGIPLDKCVLPEAIATLGAVPIADFALPSSAEVPQVIREHIKKTDVLLLANHGALTTGKDLLSAYYKMETLEHSARITWLAHLLGNVNVLPANQAERIMALREKYNLSGPIMSCDPTPLKKQGIPEMSRKTEPQQQKNPGLTDEMIEKIREQINRNLSK